MSFLEKFTRKEIYTWANRINIIYETFTVSDNIRGYFLWPKTAIQIIAAFFSAIPV